MILLPFISASANHAGRTGCGERLDLFSKCLTDRFYTSRNNPEGLFVSRLQVSLQSFNSSSLYIFIWMHKAGGNGLDCLLAQ